jgi:fructose-1,6-bisphosphatase/inositol monophosphatase family enzyme
MEHSTRRLFIAEKNEGAYMNGEKINVASITTLDHKTKLYIDEHWEINRKIFSEKLKRFNVSDLRSFAAYFADLASGNVDAVLGCTRKDNLEPAIGFGLTQEAGGIIVAIDGSNWSDKRYGKFGQDVQIPFVAAATNELAKQILDYLRT